MKRRLPLLLLLLLALLPVSASAVGMVTEAKYDAGKLVLTAYADDDTVTVKNEKPSDIVLLLDTSSTMNTKNTNGAAYLAEVKAAVESFISDVVKEASETNEVNQIAILSYASTVKANVALTDASEVQSKLNRNILRVLDGSSNIATALTEAQTQFDDSDPAERNQIVILLYDSSTTTTDAARVAAITAAGDLRARGVELFCVDYAAQAQTDFAAALATDYFNKTTDLSVSGDFTAVLAKIVRQMGGTVYRPDGTAELRVTLSNAFAAPSADQIRVRAEKCLLFDTDQGRPKDEGWEEQALLTGYTVKIEDRTVTVTGFDYAANAVHGNDGAHGARLVVEIPLTWSATSGTDKILTSGKQATSGVYFKEVRLEPFTASSSVTFTENTYTVVHQRADGTTDKTTTHPILSGQADDLTTKASSGYLYGGLGLDTALPDGESAVSFHPTPNTTYTIREVPATYLRPYVYSVWRESGAQKTVTGLCLLTTVDGADYLKVGFATGGQEDPKASLCGTMTVKEGSTVTDRLVVVNGALTSDEERPSTGQIGYHVLDGHEFTRFQSSPLTFRPYWITNDGIRVSGPTTWTCTHRGSGTIETYAFVKISPQTGASSTKWVGTDS